MIEEKSPQYFTPYLQFLDALCRGEVDTGSHHFSCSAFVSFFPHFLWTTCY